MLFLKINKKIIEIITINKSVKNGPETKASGIEISKIDAIRRKIWYVLSFIIINLDVIFIYNQICSSSCNNIYSK